MLHSKFCHRFVSESTKKFRIWPKKFWNSNFSQYFFQYLCFIFWMLWPMTLIEVASGSRQFNLASCNPLTKFLEKTQKKFQQYFLDGEFVVPELCVGIKNLIRYRENHAISLNHFLVRIRSHYFFTRVILTLWLRILTKKW